ncbi:pteridine reductase [Pseudomonas sp. BF-R-19]|uniref:pteridine reductase n=1 Tax=Pseudomonas sp. BF-R-19 TaxID=2832397 RepID=UPI001CBAA192|nr:pteridine reductase [Pseudomonas sp. BF-R-19]
MSNTSLKGKAIMVTGGARRVGAAIVRTLHEAGASIILHYRQSGEQAAELADRLNWERSGSVSLLQADLLDTAGLARLVESAAESFGRLDGLINNASSFYPTPFGKIDEDNWSDLIGSNFKAPLFLSQAAWPHLKESAGSIVNIIDINAERPIAGFSTYCAAKAGLLGLTKALAIEMGPHVRVNGVSPGAIEWPADGLFDEATCQRVIDSTLLKRTGEPQDIARTVLFLMADAPYISGQILAVDGGRSAHL